MDRLDDFKAYQKARSLFEAVADDMTSLARHPVCSSLVAQQIAAADSVCANIEEGFGRGSKKEFAQFLNYTRGSLREVRGRYERMSRWLPRVDVGQRLTLCSEILAMITRTITRLRE